MLDGYRLSGTVIRAQVASWGAILTYPHPVCPLPPSPSFQPAPPPTWNYRGGRNFGPVFEGVKTKQTKSNVITQPVEWGCSSYTDSCVAVGEALIHSNPLFPDLQMGIIHTSKNC